MTAALPVALRPELHVLEGGRGRPSITRLSEMRALIEDLRDELEVSIHERREFASFTLAAARRSQVALAHGHNPATMLDELEREAIRESNRALCAGIDGPDDAA